VPVALQAITPEQLQTLIPGSLLEDTRKITACVHRDEDPFEPRSGIRRGTREALLQMGHVPTLRIEQEIKSSLDPFIKFGLRTHDERVIETVRIPLEKEGRFTACVSSQIGCAIACAFCATGKLGLLRNLEPWEILEQVRIVRRSLPPGARVHGVVFQGMGEPLANLDRVLSAIAVLTHPCGLGIDGRNITVCTSGQAQGILRLARTFPKVRLGLSIGSADRSVRQRIMPIDTAHALDDVIEACIEHANITQLSPMWAVTLLQDVNDSVADARALTERVKAFHARTGVRPRISIIAYNAIAETNDPFERSVREAAFREVLHEASVPTHRRYSGGSDVGAACGQLAGRA
jgi:23S rRNA (adenine2503-C2)-methyltransferase